MTRQLIAAGLIIAATAAAPGNPRLGAQGFALPPGARAEPPDPNVPLHFEAASIKLNKEGGPGRRINRAPGGRFSTGNAPATMLIMFAHQLQAYQLVGTIPDWARNDGFDIVAKLENEPAPVDPSAGPDHMMLAMRSLLADRFKLKFRREKREMDIYQLVMARPGGKPGPGLKPSVDECGQQGVGRQPVRPDAGGAPQGPPLRADGTPVFCGFQQGPGRFLFNGFALSQFANGISSRVGRQVIDRTGLTGEWSFELTFQPPAAGPPPPPGVTPPPVDTSVPDLFTAIQETLGLKLESAKGMVDVFILESIERPTED
jgi:uncharacterized protein (TIGR03435 family)